MVLTKQSVIDFAKNEDFDLIGFASRDRFKDVPEDKNPFTIAPDAKTVIVVGKRITRGTLRGIEEGTNFEDYTRFGMKELEHDYVSESVFNLSRFIERFGKEAVPIFTTNATATTYGNSNDQVVPDINYAATACGLGVVGLNGLFLTERFGPRQKFQMIVTDAEFESDPLVTRKLCDECGVCKKSCPLHAIKDETDNFNVCGLEVPVARINYGACAVCKNGPDPRYLNVQAIPDRIAAICSRNCMIHLEEKGLIENTFVNKFRKRKTWAVDINGNNVEPYEE